MCLKVKSPVPEDGSFRVEIKRVPRGNCLGRAWRWGVSVLSRCTPSSLKNTFQVVKTMELSQTIKRLGRHDKFFTTFPTIGGVQLITTQPAVMQAILRNPRTSDNGWFADVENSKLFCSFVKKLWPADIVTEQDMKDVKNAMPLSTHARYRSIIRAPLVAAMRPLSTLSATMRGYAEEFLSDVSGDVNGHVVGYQYALFVLERYVLGQQNTREALEPVALAISSIAEQMNNSVLRLPCPKDFETHLARARGYIETVIKCESPFLEDIRAKNLTPKQVRAYLFIVLFAGTETTASLINYLLGALSANTTLQQRIRDDDTGSTAENVVDESLRIHPPAYIMGRQVTPNADLLFTFSRQGRVIKKIRVLAGQTIILSPYGSGRQCVEPNVFSPDRDGLSQRRSKPFASGGVHECPGKYMALADIRAFVSVACERFTIESQMPEADLTQRGVFSLRVPPQQVRFQR